MIKKEKFIFLNTILDNNYHFIMSFRFLSIFQKNEQLFQVESTIEAFLTVDRASIRATNENAKPWN